MFQVAICLELEKRLYQIKNHIPHRDHPEILELYNGRVCTEISVATGGDCIEFDPRPSCPRTPSQHSNKLTIIPPRFPHSLLGPR